MRVRADAAPRRVTGNMSSRLDSGVAFLRQGQLQEAWAVFRDILTSEPSNAAAWHMMGLTLLQAGQRQDAISHIRRSIALDPASPAAYGNLANALRDDGQLQEALQSADRGLALDPGFLNAKVVRACTLADLDRLDEALAVYDAILTAHPETTWVLPNRANVLRRMNRHAEALRDLERAMALFPDRADIRVVAGYTHLALGDFGKGLELSEWRWREGSGFGWLMARAFTQPLWTGDQPLEGRTILLYGEQGHGDTLQFCRYATLVKVRGARVILEADRSLIGLLGSLEGPDVLVARGEDLPPFDLHCPLMSLPAAFHTRLETIPADVPYLRADPAAAAAWRLKLKPTGRPKVGLVWSGGHRPDQPELWPVNARRNLPLAKLMALKGVDADFYSLQKGEPGERELRTALAQGWAGPPIIDLAPEIGDFRDTAAVIEALDLVISVDTSTAHLAGALGKPVLILSRFDACWRWMLDRADSPWYPTVRLLRQPTPGDWDSVMGEVGQFLAAMPAGAERLIGERL